ncbi:MAG: DEAD/DEAH box helicase, partial [Hyphomonas sp.]|nr:DEAD/DEAH box helicase [Hyphomonas sp.]
MAMGEQGPEAGGDGGADRRPQGGVASVCDVLLPVAVDTAYSYRIPAGLPLAPGDLVRVPLGAREATGVVWACREGDGGNLKSVAARLDTAPMAERLRALVDWIAWYTLTPRGAALSLALRPPEPDGNGERPKFGVRLVGPPPLRMTPSRARAIAAAEGGLLMAKRAICDMAGVSSAVIDALVDEGTFVVEPLPSADTAPRPDPDHAAPALSPEQRAAAEALRARVLARDFSVTLLEGVTGSGKTEVYFEAVAAALRAGRQALILMPEIALTAEFVARFTARFGVPPGLWHSGVSGRKRERLHAAVGSGEAKVVAGARSALFLPFRDLAAIIIDEEHEAAYKQDEGVPYH